jgi:hypothetical protein
VTIKGEADIQTVRRSHSSETRRKLSYIRSETAIVAVSISRGVNRQELEQLAPQAVIIFLQRWPALMIRAFVHRIKFL